MCMTRSDYGKNMLACALQVALKDLYKAGLGSTIEGGILKPPQACCGSDCPSFNIGKVISDKRCPRC